MKHDLAEARYRRAEDIYRRVSGRLAHQHQVSTTNGLEPVAFDGIFEVRTLRSLLDNAGLFLEGGLNTAQPPRVTDEDTQVGPSRKEIKHNVPVASMRSPSQTAHAERTCETSDASEILHNDATTVGTDVQSDHLVDIFGMPQSAIRADFTAIVLERDAALLGQEAAKKQVEDMKRELSRTMQAHRRDMQLMRNSVVESTAKFHDMVTQNLGDLAEVQQKAGEVDMIQTSSAALRLEIECLKSEIFMVTSERDCDSGDMADIILERIVSQIVQEDATSQLRLKELELHQALCVSSGPEEAMQPKFEGTFESSSQHKEPFFVELSHAQSELAQKQHVPATAASMQQRLDTAGCQLDATRAECARVASDVAVVVPGRDAALLREAEAGALLPRKEREPAEAHDPLARQLEAARYAEAAAATESLEAHEGAASTNTSARQIADSQALWCESESHLASHQKETESAVLGGPVLKTEGAKCALQCGAVRSKEARAAIANEAATLSETESWTSHHTHLEGAQLALAEKAQEYQALLASLQGERAEAQEAREECRRLQLTVSVLQREMHQTEVDIERARSEHSRAIQELSSIEFEQDQLRRDERAATAAALAKEVHLEQLTGAHETSLQEARAASLRELVEAREEMQGMREEGDSLRHQLDRVIQQGVRARVEARQVAESEAAALRQLAEMKSRLECGQRQLAETVESHEKQLAETLRSAKESDIHHGETLARARGELAEAREQLVEMEHLKLSAANLDRQVGCLHSQLQSAESMSERAAAEAAELVNERDRARASANDIALQLQGAERELEEATSERLALVEKHRVDHEAAMQAAEQHKARQAETAQELQEVRDVLGHLQEEATFLRHRLSSEAERAAAVQSSADDRTAALASERDAAQQARDETAASLCAKERELEEAALAHHRLTASLEEQLADAEAMAEQHKEQNTQSMLELLEAQLFVDDLTSQAAAFRQQFSAEMERAERVQSSLQNELAAVAFERDSALQNEATESQRACALEAAANAAAEAHHCQMGALLADQAAAAEASLRAQEELDAATQALAQTREALGEARSEAKVVQGALADANERAESAQASWREELTSAMSGGNAARLEADRTARQLAAAKRVVAHTLEAFGGEMQEMRQAAAESSKQQQERLARALDELTEAQAVSSEVEGARQRAESLQCSLDTLEGELERARQQVRATLQDAAQVEADRDVALAMQRDVAAKLSLANSRLEEAAQTHNLQLERAIAEAKEAAEVAARDREARERSLQELATSQQSAETLKSKADALRARLDRQFEDARQAQRRLRDEVAAVMSERDAALQARDEAAQEAARSRRGVKEAVEEYERRLGQARELQESAAFDREMLSGTQCEPFIIEDSRSEMDNQRTSAAALQSQLDCLRVELETVRHEQDQTQKTLVSIVTERDTAHLHMAETSEKLLATKFELEEAVRMHRHELDAVRNYEVDMEESISQYKAANDDNLKKLVQSELMLEELRVGAVTLHRQLDKERDERLRVESSAQSQIESALHERDSALDAQFNAVKLVDATKHEMADATQAHKCQIERLLTAESEAAACAEVQTEALATNLALLDDAQLEVQHLRSSTTSLLDDLQHANMMLKQASCDQTGLRREIDAALLERDAAQHGRRDADCLGIALQLELDEAVRTTAQQSDSIERLEVEATAAERKSQETLEATERQIATMHEQLRELDSLESAKLDLRIQLDSANSELQEAILQQGHMLGEVASITEERDFVHLDFEEASCRVKHLEDELSGALSMCEQERMAKNWLIEDVEEETASLIRNHQDEYNDAQAELAMLHEQLENDSFLQAEVVRVQASQTDLTADLALVREERDAANHAANEMSMRMVSLQQSLERSLQCHAVDMQQHLSEQRQTQEAEAHAIARAEVQGRELRASSAWARLVMKAKLENLERDIASVHSQLEEAKMQLSFVQSEHSAAQMGQQAVSQELNCLRGTMETALETHSQDIQIRDERLRILEAEAARSAINLEESNAKMLAEMEAAQSALVEFAALKDALESVRGQLAKATLELEEAKRRQPESESARYVKLAQEALAAARSPPASECEPPCVGTRAPTLPMDDGQLAAYQDEHHRALSELAELRQKLDHLGQQEQHNPHRKRMRVDPESTSAWGDAQGQLQSIEAKLQAAVQAHACSVQQARGSSPNMVTWSSIWGALSHHLDAAHTSIDDVAGALATGCQKLDAALDQDRPADIDSRESTEPLDWLERSLGAGAAHADVGTSASTPPSPRVGGGLCLTGTQTEAHSPAQTTAHTQEACCGTDDANAIEAWASEEDGTRDGAGAARLGRRSPRSQWYQNCMKRRMRRTPSRGIQKHLDFQAQLPSLEVLSQCTGAPSNPPRSPAPLPAAELQEHEAAEKAAALRMTSAALRIQSFERSRRARLQLQTLRRLKPLESFLLRNGSAQHTPAHLLESDTCQPKCITHSVRAGDTWFEGTLPTCASIHEPSTSATARYAGWLWKVGGTGSVMSWNKRFFFLGNEILSYYLNDTFSDLKGDISLVDDVMEPCAVTSKVWTDASSPQSFRLDGLVPTPVYYFALQTTCRVFVMAAPSSSLRGVWIQKIDAELRQCRGDRFFQGIPCHKQGPLLKRGGHKATLLKVKNWKLRHFIVTPGRVDYYAPSSALGTGLEWKGGMELLNASVAHASDESSAGRGAATLSEPGGDARYLRFHVQTKERKLHLGCESEEDMKDWTTALRAACFNTQIQSGPAQFSGWLARQVSSPKGMSEWTMCYVQIQSGRMECFMQPPTLAASDLDIEDLTSALEESLDVSSIASEDYKSSDSFRGCVQLNTHTRIKIHLSKLHDIYEVHPKDCSSMEFSLLRFLRSDAPCAWPGVNELRAVKKHAPAGYTSSAADLLPQIFAVEQFEMSTMDTDLHQQKNSSPFVMRFAARNAQEMEAWVRQIDLMANLYGCAAVMLPTDKLHLVWEASKKTIGQCLESIVSDFDLTTDAARFYRMFLRDTVANEEQPLENPDQKISELLCSETWESVRSCLAQEQMPRHILIVRNVGTTV